jgi:membrane associated rhomboid family serine protease
VSAVHLFANLALFALVGWRVEREYGAARVVVIVLLSVFGGGLLSAVSENGCVVVAGLSGGVFGLIGLFCVDMARHWRKQLLRILVFFILFTVTVVSTFIETTGVSQASHLGGLITGFLPGLLIQRDLPHELLELVVPIVAIVSLFIYFLTTSLVFYLQVLPSLAIC